jgi:hypothetical protein
MVEMSPEELAEFERFNQALMTMSPEQERGVMAVMRFFAGMNPANAAESAGQSRGVRTGSGAVHGERR